MSIDHAALTDRGRSRARNEDAVLAEESSGGSGLLLAVADGVGGLRDGAGASAEVIERLREVAADGAGPLFERVRDAVLQANDSLFERAKAGTAGLSGTTVVAAVFEGTVLRLLPVGDSRAYLARGGSLVRLTEDHSVVAEQVRAGLLTEAEAEVSPRRNVITKAVGTEADLGPTLSEGVSLLPGDIVLLSTDGLHGVVPATELAELLRRNAAAAEIARALIDRANALGGPDNISVAVARIPHSQEGSLTLRGSG